MGKVMEKINYGFVLQQLYPDSKWSIKSGSKGYEYEAYIWDDANTKPMPSKEELTSAWPEVKRLLPIWQYVIEERNKKLTESDKFVLPDFPISEEIRMQWYDYRKALRDITSTAEPFYNNQGKIEVQWPKKPL